MPSGEKQEMGVSFALREKLAPRALRSPLGWKNEEGDG